MYQVCAKYCGTTISLEEFETQEKAEHFSESPFILFYKDEIENGEEDEIIYPSEMWVEEALPFTDPTVKQPEYEFICDDDLPF